MSPQDTFYALNSPFDTLRVHVGLVTPNTNIHTLWTTRTWLLLNSNGVVIQRGEVNVQLNSFSSFVDLTGLTTGKIYSLAIENPCQRVTTTAIISTVDVRSVRVINEKFLFSGNPKAIGNIVLVPVPAQGKTMRWRAQFPPEWVTSSTEGTGVIVSQGSTGDETYAYAPTAIYTRNRFAPAFINFVAFRGLPAIRIPIYQLPTIIREANHLYSISPATRVVVTWRQSVRRNEMFSYDSQVPVASVDLEKTSDAPIASVKISVLFD